MDDTNTNEAMPLWRNTMELFQTRVSGGHVVKNRNHRTIGHILDTESVSVFQVFREFDGEDLGTVQSVFMGMKLISENT